MADRLTPEDCARWLRNIAADVRLAGDMALLRFTDDGVRQDMTLSDELWLVAVQLDGKITPLRDPDAPPEEVGRAPAPDPAPSHYVYSEVSEPCPGAGAPYQDGECGVCRTFPGIGLGRTIGRHNRIVPLRGTDQEETPDAR